MRRKRRTTQYNIRGKKKEERREEGMRGLGWRKK